MNDLIVETSSELEAKVPAVVSLASALEVKTAEQYTGAADTLKEIKAARDAVNDFFDPMVKAAHQAHKVTVAKKKALSDPLDYAEGIVKRKLLDYRTEQERIAEAERQRLQAIADEKARKERAAIEAEAAKQHLDHTVPARRCSQAACHRSGSPSQGREGTPGSRAGIGRRAQEAAGSSRRCGPKGRSSQREGRDAG